MPFGQLFEVVNSIPSPWNTVLKWLLAIGLTGFLLIKTIKIVPQGQNAMRLRFGKVVMKGGRYVYLGPGMHILFPFVHNLERVSVLDRTVPLAGLQLQYGPFHVVTVQATATLAVTDIYRVRYAVDDFTGRLAAACEAQFRQVLRVVSDGDIDGCLQSVLSTFDTGIAPVAEQLGVRLKGVDITNVVRDSQFAIAGAIQSIGPNSTRALEKIGVPQNGSTLS